MPATGDHQGTSSIELAYESVGVRIDPNQYSDGLFLATAASYGYTYMTTESRAIGDFDPAARTRTSGRCSGRE